MLLKNGNPRGEGGKREGAGRKSNAVELLRGKIASDADKAREYIAAIAGIAEDPESGSKVRLAAYVYLTDRILGKPRDPKDISGELVVKIQGYTDELAG